MFSIKIRVLHIIKGLSFLNRKCRIADTHVIKRWYQPLIICVCGHYKDDTLIDFFFSLSTGVITSTSLRRKTPAGVKPGTNEKNLELIGSILSGGYPD